MFAEAGVVVLEIAFERERTYRERFEQIRDVVMEALRDLGDDRYRRAEKSLAARMTSEQITAASEAIASRYSGPIERIDGEHVLRRVAGKLVAHRREAFMDQDRPDELERVLGQEIEITYEFDGPTLRHIIALELSGPEL